jgi:hypothetical protein
LDKKRQEYFMYKHQTEAHNGMEGEYKAKVKCSFNDTLPRQLAEGVLIRRCQKNVLNSKAEWHQPSRVCEMSCVESEFFLSGCGTEIVFMEAAKIDL